MRKYLFTGLLTPALVLACSSKSGQDKQQPPPDPDPIPVITQVKPDARAPVATPPSSGYTRISARERGDPHGGVNVHLDRCEAHERVWRCAQLYANHEDLEKAGELDDPATWKPLPDAARDALFAALDAVDLDALSADKTKTAPTLHGSSIAVSVDRKGNTLAFSFIRESGQKTADARLGLVTALHKAVKASGVKLVRPRHRASLDVETVVHATEPSYFPDGLGVEMLSCKAKKAKAKVWVVGVKVMEHTFAANGPPLSIGDFQIRPKQVYCHGLPSYVRVIATRE